MRRLNTLLARIGLTLASALLVFSLITAASVAWYVLVPVGQRAAADFAALILLSAQTWAELPPATRPAFEREARATHGLQISVAETELPVSGDPIPYLSFLRTALAEISGQPVAILDSPRDRHTYAVDLTMGGRVLRLEFTDERIGSQLPLALVLALFAGASSVLVASLLLTRRLTEPLARLGRAAVAVGQGERPPDLAETGPREVAELVRGFNRMAAQVQELLRNRTTLLAGISHDLRSPIARITLALEMLPVADGSDLLDGIRRDLNELERLIGETLDLAQGLAPGKAERVDVGQLLHGLVEDHARNANPIACDFNGCGDCRLDAAALRRVLGNLLDNARRYGGEEPACLRCRREPQRLQIEVLDRGPGIPPDQLEAVFQPFYRLEVSRSRDTGGSGLGLAIVRQICQAQGWDVVLSARAGGGTSACLTIPCTA